MMEPPFEAIKRHSLLSDDVIVSYSGGKDSAVILDLCIKHFKVVHVFMMCWHTDLSFQNSVIQWVGSKYGLDVYKVPHFELSEFYKRGTLCKPDNSVPIVGINDIYTHVRGVFGCRWIAAGERAADSVVRRARIIQEGSINVKRGRFFPVAYWNKAQIVDYIKQNGLKTSPESRFLGHSFRGLVPSDLAAIRDNYPQDYILLKSKFPEIDAAIKRLEFYGCEKNKTPEVLG